MPPVASYLPCAVFAPEDDSDLGIPRVLISPPRYIQSNGVLGHIGRYLSIVPSRRPALLPLLVARSATGHGSWRVCARRNATRS